MCVSIPGQITAIIDRSLRIALVDVAGQLRTIELGLLPEGEGAIGDWVLVHAGMAISQVGAADARTIIRMLKECAELDQEERP